MADENDETTETTEETVPATDTEPEDATANLSDAGKKALTEERKARTAAERQAKVAQKQLDSLSAQLKAIEDRDKTEAQKLAERAEAAERDASGAKLELMRYRVAAEKKLPARLAARLHGATEEEMKADADALLEDLGPQKQGPPSFDGGVRKQATPASDMNSLIRQAAGQG